MPLAPEYEFLLAGMDLAMRGVGRQKRDDTSGPFISVVMPVRNRDFLIESALESLERQTWSRFEAIVVDDGSTDRTGAILADWANRHAWLRVIAGAERRGQSAARNRGLAVARGDIIAYLDSDNAFYAHALETIAETFQTSPNVWWIHTSMLWRTASETLVRCPQLSLARMAEGRGGTDLGAIAHRRGLCEAAGGFDETLTRLVDLDLMIRFAEIVMPRRIPVPTCHYRHGDWPRVSNAAPAAENLVKILDRYAPPAAVAARILYVVAPDAETAAALETELVFLRERGLRIGLFGLAPLSGAVGDLTRASAVAAEHLSEAVERFRPRLVHVVGARILEHLASEWPKIRLPLTLRLESEAEAARLHDYVKLAPSLKAAFGERAAPSATKNSYPPVLAASTPVDLAAFPLGDAKDRNLVACAADTPDAIAFVAALAARCPSYRFALDLAEAPAFETGRVEIHVGAGLGDRAERLRRSALFFDARQRAGAGDRLVEAMAAGCFALVLRPWRPSAVLEGVGAAIASEEEAAAFLSWAEMWSEARWRSIALTANERAFSQSAPALALRPLFEQWLHLMGAGLLAAREADQLVEVEAGETLSFAQGSRGEETLRVGFHVAESWGVWTGDKRAMLAFVARGGAWRSVRRLEIKAHAFAIRESGVFPVRLRLNGGDLGQFGFGAGSSAQSARLEAGSIEPDAIVRLEFATPMPQALTDHGSGDPRRLGLALAALTFATE